MIITVCSVLVIKDGLVLLIKEKKVDKYGLPGGKLEPGESLRNCAIREVKEEVGADIKINKLIMISEKPKTHEGNTVIRFIYLADILTYSSSAELEFSFISPSSINSLIKADKIRGKDIIYLLKQAQKGELETIPEPILFD